MPSHLPADAPDAPDEHDPASRFSAATTLTPLDPDDSGVRRFAGRAHPHWTIAGKPNGGYLLALLARAAVETSSHSDVIAASAHYLRAPEPGPVEVTVEVLRAGRSASQLRARLLQGDRPCVETLLTTADLDATTDPFWAAGVPDPGPGATPRDDLPRLPAVNPGGVRVDVMALADLRIDAETSGWAAGRPSGRGEVRGWLALPGDEPFDPVSLLYAVDALPPATFDIEFTGWVPTLELTAYVRAVPAPGPVRVVQRASLIADGRVDETCWVWDSRGRVVAHATQLAAIRLG
ncbi:thioesterase family protein [uncultured Jatrophihabitans sp.]|uniref:thioesterase family protein n=1 Tax=uncultured Jatrophihabitans sp. TaxID=1610747 RepID=UPI0035CAC620